VSGHPRYAAVGQVWETGEGCVEVVRVLPTAPWRGQGFFCVKPVPARWWRRRQTRGPEVLDGWRLVTSEVSRQDLGL
jgi:hypothetical protein